MPTNYKMTTRGRQRLTDREGKILKWYRDSKRLWTFGVGHLADKEYPYKKGQTFIAEEVDKVLIKDLTKFELALNKALRVPVKENEFDALLSVMFNVGTKFATSTAIKRLNAGDRKGAAEAIMMWNKPSEIIGRRSTEKSQFLTPYK